MALIPIALVAVYLIWGSSTLAMRVALETMPPFFLGAARYLLAGALLYGVLRARGVPPPTRAQWASCAKLAILFLVVGNGAVALAGTHVPCSIVSMVGATMPLMAALVEGIGRRRTSRIEVVGLTLGVVGVCLLNLHGELAACGSALLIVALSPLAWAVGTVLCRRMDTPEGPMATAAQLLTGGAMMLVVSVLFRERASEVSSRSLAAFVYLAIFGSLIAFTAYGFLLRHAKPAIATSHAYVIPLVALALGARVANERPSSAALFASVVLLSGVATITVAQLRAGTAQMRQRARMRIESGERLSIIEELATRAGERLSLS